MEDYVGQNAEAVKAMLEAKYELVVTIEKKEVDDATKYDDDGKIIAQSLAAGSEVKKKDSLVLYVPNIVEKIPDMVEEKWSLSDVEAFCNKYGFNLETKEEETTAYSEGTIIAQNLPKGREITKGMTLRVTVAIKPKAKPQEENKDTNSNNNNNSSNNNNNSSNNNENSNSNNSNNNSNNTNDTSTS